MTHPIRNLKARYAAERSAVTYPVTSYNPKTGMITRRTLGGAK